MLSRNRAPWLNGDAAGDGRKFADAMPLTELDVQDHETIVMRTKVTRTLHKMLKAITHSNACFEQLQSFLRRHGAYNQAVGKKSNTPLHYAVTARNVSLTRWLLGQRELDVNKRNRSLESPLMQLCARYDRTDDLPATELLILLLLEHGADFNVCYRKRAKLPFDMLDGSRRFSQEFRKKVLSCVRYAIAFTTPGGPSGAVSFLQQSPEQHPIRSTEELLQVFLCRQQVPLFRKHLLPCTGAPTGSIAKLIDLVLGTAIERKLQECVAEVINVAGGQIFKLRGHRAVHREPLKRMLRNACLHGNVQVLRRILHHISDLDVLNAEPLLLTTLKRIGDRRSETRRAKQIECAQLLAAHKLIDVTKTDREGNTALHLAVKFGLEEVATVLVRDRSCYIGWRNKDGDTPLEYGRQDLWRKLLDSCVVGRVRGSFQTIHKLRINVGCLKVPSEQSENDDHDWKFLRLASEYRHNEKQHLCNSEASVLAKMDCSKELHPLLRHPVIQTFIAVKWSSIAMLSYINLLLMLLTTLSFALSNIIFNITDKFNVPMQCLTMMCLAGVLMRDFALAVYLRQAYFCVESALELLLHGFVAYCILGTPESVVSFVVGVACTLQFAYRCGTWPFNNCAMMAQLLKTVFANIQHRMSFYLSLLICLLNSPMALYHAGMHVFKKHVGPAMPLRSFFATNFQVKLDENLTMGGFMLMVLAVAAYWLKKRGIPNLMAPLRYSPLYVTRLMVKDLVRYERGRWPQWVPDRVRQFFSTNFFEQYDQVVVVRCHELGKLMAKRKLTGLREAKSNLPGCSPAFLDSYFSVLWKEYTFFVVLDNECMAVAVKVIEDREKAADANNSSNSNSSSSSSIRTSNESNSSDSNMDSD